MPDFAKMSLKELLRPEGFDCACGRHHGAGLRHLRVGRGALEALPEFLGALGVKRPFVFCMRTRWRQRAMGCRRSWMPRGSPMSSIPCRPGIRSRTSWPVAAS